MKHYEDRRDPDMEGTHTERISSKNPPPIHELPRRKSYERLSAPLLLNELARDISHWATGKGFWDIPASIQEACDNDPEVRKWLDNKIASTKQMLIVTEVAELIEGLRKPGQEDPNDAAGFTSEESESADQIIRILDFCGKRGLRIGEAVCAKMTKNEGRPHMHGKGF
jgi:hypothetical protein